MTPYAEAHARLRRIELAFRLVCARNPHYQKAHSWNDWHSQYPWKRASEKGEEALAKLDDDQARFDALVHGKFPPPTEYDTDHTWWMEYLDARVTALHSMRRLGKTSAEMLQTLNLADEFHVNRILNNTTP